MSLLMIVFYFNLTIMLFNVFMFVAIALETQTGR